MSSVNTHSIISAVVWNQQPCFSHASQFLTLYIQVLFYEIWTWHFSYAGLPNQSFHTKILKVVYPSIRLRSGSWLPHIHMCVHISCLKSKIHILETSPTCQKKELISFNYVIIFYSVSLRFFGFQPVYHTNFPLLPLSFLSIPFSFMPVNPHTTLSTSSPPTS